MPSKAITSGPLSRASGHALWPRKAYDRGMVNRTRISSAIVLGLFGLLSLPPMLSGCKSHTPMAAAAAATTVAANTVAATTVASAAG